MQTLLCLQDGVLLQPRMSKVGVSSAQGVLLEVEKYSTRHCPGAQGQKCSPNDNDQDFFQSQFQSENKAFQENLKAAVREDFETPRNGVFPQSLELEQCFKLQHILIYTIKDIWDQNTVCWCMKIVGNRVPESLHD